MHSLSSRPLPESAVFGMRLPILWGMPPSYRNRHVHDALLQSAGHDLTHPIVIYDSDNDNDNNEGDIRPSARQTRKRTPPPERGQINPAIRRSRRRNQESSSFSHLQSNTSPDVFYPDLSAKLLRAENDINAGIVAQVVSVATRQCSVCGDSSPIAELPSLADCEHLPQTCSTCYAGWITVQLQESNWREARCPENTCHVKMTYSEIQQNALVEIFQQYDTFIARAVLNEDRKFRHSAL
jgi:hypothetical protein